MEGRIVRQRNSGECGWGCESSPRNGIVSTQHRASKSRITVWTAIPIISLLPTTTSNDDISPPNPTTFCRDPGLPDHANITTTSADDVQPDGAWRCAATTTATCCNAASSRHATRATYATATLRVHAPPNAAAAAATRDARSDANDATAHGASRRRRRKLQWQWKSCLADARWKSCLSPKRWFWSWSWSWSQRSLHARPSPNPRYECN